MGKILTLYLLAICCLAGIPLPGHTEPGFENLSQVTQAATQFIHQAYDHNYKISVNIGYLDNRLHLASCKLPLEGFFPPNMQNVIATSVGVRCPEPSWQVYMPVQIQAYANILTASRPLARGTMISASDIQFRKRDIAQYLSGVFRHRQQLIGMVLKQPVSVGSVFTPRMVAPKRLVIRGDPVTIMAKTGGMTVRVQGQALMDGYNGQMIQVKNTSSGRKLVAEVVATSTVMVKM